MGLKDILNASKIRKENDGLKELMSPEFQDAASLNSIIAEVMRKLSSLLVAVLLLSIVGCTSDEAKTNNAIEDSIYEEEVYSEGYRDGADYVMSAIKSDYRYYIDAEQLEEVLREQYGDSADDMRDIIFDNLNLYTTEDIIGNAEISIEYSH